MIQHLVNMRTKLSDGEEIGGLGEEISEKKRQIWWDVKRLQGQEKFKKVRPGMRSIESDDGGRKGVWGTCTRADLAELLGLDGEDKAREQNFTNLVYAWENHKKLRERDLPPLRRLQWLIYLVDDRGITPFAELRDIVRRAAEQDKASRDSSAHGGAAACPSSSSGGTAPATAPAAADEWGMLLDGVDANQWGDGHVQVCC